MKIEVTQEEKSIIEELLSKELSDLPIEIHHCRTNEYKTMLKDKQKHVEDLFERIKTLH
jgi:hypothetical protein